MGFFIASKKLKIQSASQGLHKSPWSGPRDSSNLSSRSSQDQHIYMLCSSHGKPCCLPTQ